MNPSSLLAAAMLLTVAGCTARPAAPLTPSTVCPPAVSVAEAPPAEAPAIRDAGADAAAPAEDEEAPSEDGLTYADCEVLRGEDEDAPPRGPGWLWPKLCGRVLGWVGSGAVMRSYAFGFSRDARRFVSCRAEAACEVIDLRKGRTVEQIEPDWSREEGAGAIPVEETPRIARLFERLGVSLDEVSFPYAKDIQVSWFIERGGGALHVTFVDRASGVEQEVLRFPKRGPLSEQPIVPERAWLSPGGGVLAFRVATTQGGSGIEAGLVNVHAEAAALFRAVAEQRPDLRKDALAKAVAAEARSRGVARVLP